MGWTIDRILHGPQQTFKTAESNHQKQKFKWHLLKQESNGYTPGLKDGHQFDIYHMSHEAIERADSYGISDLENSLPSH